MNDNRPYYDIQKDDTEKRNDWQYNSMIYAAFDRNNGKPIYEESNYTSESLNLSSIATFLIQKVGRFTEHYASDFLIDWNMILTACKEMDDINDEVRAIFALGIREDGVDHNSYITCRINENDYLAYQKINYYYRGIYAVEVKRTKIREYWQTVVTLKDIRHSLDHKDYALYPTYQSYVDAIEAKEKANEAKKNTKSEREKSE